MVQVRHCRTLGKLLESLWLIVLSNSKGKAGPLEIHGKTKTLLRDTEQTEYFGDWHNVLKNHVSEIF